MWTLPSFTPGSLFWSMLTLHSAMLSRIISKNKKKKRKKPVDGELHFSGFSEG